MLSLHDSECADRKQEPGVQAKPSWSRDGQVKITLRDLSEQPHATVLRDPDVYLRPSVLIFTVH
jgi:hypothetical protein